MSCSKLHNKLPDFYKQPPEYQSFIGLFLLDWEEKFGMGFGEDMTADIAESEAEAKAQYQYYADHGYILRDENAFGSSRGESYRISIYTKIIK